jgi:hypothetical protein
MHPMMDQMDRSLQSFGRGSMHVELVAKPQRKTSDLNLPEPFRRLVELIEDAPSRLKPSRISKLLEEAGLRAEVEDLYQHAQNLGLKAEVILSIMLANLLEGPLAQSLSPDARRASESLQEFAQQAKDIMRQIAGHGSAFMNEFQESAQLNLVQSGRLDEIAHVIGPLAGWMRLLDHLEEFLHKQAEQLEAYKISVTARGAGAGQLDLSGIGANVNWDLSPDRLRVGDLSAIDQTIALKIQNAAANTVVVDIAQELGIDPVVLVLGLIARAEGPKNRSAERIAKAIFGKTSAEKLNTLSQILWIK